MGNEDILRLLQDSGFYLNLSQQAVNLFRFRVHVLAHFCGLWFKCQFSLLGYSGVLSLYAAQANLK